MIYALRILLDKKLSESDIEPKDSDLYVHEHTNKIYIQLKFENVIEDSVVGKIGKYVSDDGLLYLAYQAEREETGEKKYEILMGQASEEMDVVDSRFYLRVLNMDYIQSNRELFSYIKKGKEKFTS